MSSLRYSKDHCWVRKTENGAVIGITDYVRKQIVLLDITNHYGCARIFGMLLSMLKKQKNACSAKSTMPMYAN